MSEAQKPTRGGRPVVLALIAGVVLGGGAVGVGWLTSSSDSSGSGSGARADAVAACEAMARTTTIDPVTGLAGPRRWSGASELAAAAAEQDPGYRKLADAISKPLQIGQRTFDYESPEVIDAVAAAREACGEV
ncbi:hypothetical protein BAY61_03440 [Prauserella marina]|uniref:Uncharacterized protein n=1 Tax=Prauserella marina TaxID=530584 RepID=A0A222VYN9_9PSEU|nr:hypothetical protein [Prauserella marina]ASR38922.1 hypothetical protein BAY61_03440 [Prauserella marina]PWV70882.1 hypothetical protein DES30_11418 [Prauserella marina]SDE01798.1 hypothetical protein SAMN05421630_11724 [Prauserella marina]